MGVRGANGARECQRIRRRQQGVPKRRHRVVVCRRLESQPRLVRMRRSIVADRSMGSKRRAVKIGRSVVVRVSRESKRR